MTKLIRAPGVAAFTTTQTSYPRLCAADVLAPETRRVLETLNQSRNPLQRRCALGRELDRLCTLAAPDPRRAPANTEIRTPSFRRFLEAPKRWLS